jgi:hypothetical protein
MDALSEAAAGLVAVLHPNAGTGFDRADRPDVRVSLRSTLCNLRHHLREHSLLLGALEDAGPTARSRLAPVVNAHREVRRLSRDLCGRVRDEDIRGARLIAQALWEKLLDHEIQERQLWTTLLRDLGPGETGRLCDALFRRMQRDSAARTGSAPDRGSLAELHVLYVRQIHKVQGRWTDPQLSEADHEHTRRG